jgi:hypothetical protein
MAIRVKPLPNSISSTMGAKESAELVADVRTGNSRGNSSAWTAKANNVLNRLVWSTSADTAVTPMVEQRRMKSPNRAGFCGVASTLMVIARARAGVMPIDITNAAQVQNYARQMYIEGVGSDGELMAEAMRNAGVPAELVSHASIRDIVLTLQAGQSVPLGVREIHGTVTKDTTSVKYGQLKANSNHSKKFGPEGHWVVVTGFEGSPQNPTFFTVNDPDTGATLRLSRAQLDASASPKDRLIIQRPKL